jgi:uncharacterized protein YacL
VKGLLILGCSLIGYAIAYHSYDQWWQWGIGLAFGLLISGVVIRTEQMLRKVPLRVILGGTAGVFAGLLIAFLLAYGLGFAGQIMEKKQVVPWLYALLTGIMGYLGLVIGAKKVEEIGSLGWGEARLNGAPRILDTSVIIDGRIADIADTGFLEGTLMVPRFVLDELQYIADSSDSLKRARGRRGLDILNRIQSSSGIVIDVVDHDFPKIKGVDAKLVALARSIQGMIITNDFNLNKVAELQGIKILNVNELANALKPVVLPGELMTVKIIKEGKEPGQGVAYLDDGTMIVVDNAQKLQGMNVEALVTSVLQTTAGRMIFSELKPAVTDRKTAPAGAKP